MRITGELAATAIAMARRITRADFIIMINNTQNLMLIKATQTCWLKNHNKNHRNESAILSKIYNFGSSSLSSRLYSYYFFSFFVKYVIISLRNWLIVTLLKFSSSFWATELTNYLNFSGIKLPSLLMKWILPWTSWAQPNKTCINLSF